MTLSAAPVLGAACTLRRLKELGYTLAPVADGPRATFENVLKPRRLWTLFDAYAISEEVERDKPDPSMFRKGHG